MRRERCEDRPCGVWDWCCCSQRARCSRRRVRSRPGQPSFQGSFLAILTPVAVIAVMALGAAAWLNKISWGWAITGVAGIVLVFGAPQIVAWIRGMFGV